MPNPSPTPLSPNRPYSALLGPTRPHSAPLGRATLRVSLPPSSVRFWGRRHWRQPLNNSNNNDNNTNNNKKKNTSTETNENNSTPPTAMAQSWKLKTNRPKVQGRSVTLRRGEPVMKEGTSTPSRSTKRGNILPIVLLHPQQQHRHQG